MKNYKQEKCKHRVRKLIGTGNKFAIKCEGCGFIDKNSDLLKKEMRAK